MENKTGNAGERNPESPVNSDDDKAAEDRFYEKLGKLNESSGLSLVFKFRETMLDLHSLYKEVIKRGGFYQITKIGKWDDVASASSLKTSVLFSASQLQNVYEILLLQYELMYSHKIPGGASTWHNKCSQGFSLSCSTGKRKHCEKSSLFSFSNLDKQTCSDWPTTTHENSTTITVDPEAPVRPRTGYQIFLRLETHRLKMLHGESSSSHNLRNMAVNAWRSLSDKDKQPYLEASKMDKERYDKEISGYTKELANNNENPKSQSLFSNRTSSMLNFSTSSETDDVYHVSLEADSENLHSPDESMVELAIEVMKNAQSNDPIFQIDLESGSPHIP